MLLASAGIAGLGLLLLGIQGQAGEGSEAGSLLRSPIVGWFLVFLGGLLLLLTLISGLLHPAASEPTVVATDLPPPSPQATGLPTIPPTDIVPPTPIPTTVPPPVLEPGWTLREHAEAGFAIALPTSWVEMDLSADTMEKALAPIVTCCPEMDLSRWEGETIAALRKSGLRLFAVDPDSDPEAVYYGFVSVARTSLGEGWTLDMAVKAVLGEDEDDESKLTHQRVMLPVGEAEEIRFAEDGDPPARTIRYLLVQYDAFWFIAIGCEVEFADRYEPIFETVPQTFRWVAAPTE
jgi:hypothetical protein